VLLVGYPPDVGLLRSDDEAEEVLRRCGGISNRLINDTLQIVDEVCDLTVVSFLVRPRFVRPRVVTLVWVDDERGLRVKELAHGMAFGGIE